MSALRFGVLLPTREMAMQGRYDFAPIIEFARQAERHEFDSLWVGDSFIARPRLEPLTVLATVAAFTNHITIGTAALIAVRREPVTLAHTISTLDHACDGRLCLAIGTGAPLPVKSELDAMTMTYAERAGRVDEAIALWKRGWSDAEGSLSGEYADLSALREQPPPAQAGGPPMWLASNASPRAVTRAARDYDGWMPLIPEPEEYAKGWELIKSEAETRFGRDPETLTPSLFATVNIGPDAAQANDELDDYARHYYGLPLDRMSHVQPYYGGTAAGCVDWLTDYARAGARHFVLRMGTFDDPLAQLRVCADQVLLAVRERVGALVG